MSTKKFTDFVNKSSSLFSLGERGAELLNAVIKKEYNLTNSTTLSLWTNLVIQHIDKLNIEELRSIINPLDKITRGLTSNKNTLKGIFTKIRKPIRLKYGKDSEYWKIILLGKFGFTKSERKKMDKSDLKRLKKNAENQTEIDITDILDLLLKTSKSHDMLDRIIAVMLACGMRKIELLNDDISTFSIIKSNDYRNGWMSQKGIAKQLAYNGDELIIEYPIIGISGENVMRLINRIRREFNTNPSVIKFRKKIKNKEELNGVLGSIHTYNKHLCAMVRELIPQANKVYSKTHLLRRIYGNIAYDLIGINLKPSKTRNSFLQDILGHTSQAMSLHYNTVRILNNKNIDLKASLKRFDDSKNDIKNDIIENDVIESGEIRIRVGRRENEKEKAQRIKNLIEEMKLKGKSITHRNVKVYGFGSNAISKFWSMNKDWITKMKQKN